MIQANVTKRLQSLESDQKEAKIQKEMLDDLLADDTDLQAAKEKLEAAQKNFKMTKEMVLNEPAAAKIVEKMKDIAEDIKLTKQMLSGELLSYYVETGSDVIEMDSETSYKIKFNGNVSRKATDTDEE